MSDTFEFETARETRDRWQMDSARFAEFRRLWSAYQQALAQPFASTPQEDEAIKAQVSQTFDALSQLAREVP